MTRYFYFKRRKAGALRRSNARPIFSWHCSLLAHRQSIHGQIANLQLVDAALANTEFANCERTHSDSSDGDGSYSGRT